jgi:hypothetical protein
VPLVEGIHLHACETIQKIKNMNNKNNKHDLSLSNVVKDSANILYKVKNMEEGINSLNQAIMKLTGLVHDLSHKIDTKICASAVQQGSEATLSSEQFYEKLQGKELKRLLNEILRKFESIQQLS